MTGLEMAAAGSAHLKRALESVQLGEGQCLTAESLFGSQSPVPKLTFIAISLVCRDTSCCVLHM